MPHIDAQELAGRYAAVWNERDPELRRKAVHALWSPDGVHALLPPQELRESAVRLGFPTAALEPRGHRATAAHAQQLNDVVTFRWESVLTQSGEVTGGGLEFVVVAEDGRIVRDYQFVGV